MKTEKWLAWKRFVVEHEGALINRLISVQGPQEVETLIGDLLFSDEGEAIEIAAVYGCLTEAIEENWILCEVTYRPGKSAAELLTKETLLPYREQMLDQDLSLLE